MINNFFIGYGSIEELLYSAKKPEESGVVFISKSIETRPAQFHLRNVQWFVTAAVVSGNICHYWRMSVGNYATMDGKPVHGNPSTEADCEQRANSLIKLLDTIVNSQNYSVVNGLISFPSDNVLIDGTTVSITYDKKTNEFCLKQKSRKVSLEINPKINGSE